MFKIILDKSVDVAYDKLVFSGGEVQIRLHHNGAPVLRDCDLDIFAHITSSEEVMELLLVVDALKRCYKFGLKTLTIPYLPYARQDRVMEYGESLSCKVFCSLINSLCFDKVVVWDAHSPVSLALLNNVENIGPEHFLVESQAYKPMVTFSKHAELFTKTNVVLVSPDAGAAKKVDKVGQALGRPVVVAGKHRDTNTGAITGTYIMSGDKTYTEDFLIVDDICDGGRTFIELSKALRPLTSGRILLYVTHGIFSKGLDVFPNIDLIMTPNPFPLVDRTHPKLKVI